MFVNTSSVDSLLFTTTSPFDVCEYEPCRTCYSLQPLLLMLVNTSPVDSLLFTTTSPFDVCEYKPLQNLFVNVSPVELDPCVILYGAVLWS